jgi:hypothetical protein
LFTLLLSAAESSSSDDGDSEKSEDEDAEDKPKSKKIKETTYEWELLNDVKAIWLRNPKEVTEEEYTKFYHSLAKVICLHHTCVLLRPFISWMGILWKTINQVYMDLRGRSATGFAE